MKYLDLQNFNFKTINSHYFRFIFKSNILTYGGYQKSLIKSITYSLRVMRNKLIK